MSRQVGFRFSVVLALLALGASGASTWADEVLSGPNNGNWGDPNSAQDLLKMNRDPEIVRTPDPDEEAGIYRKGVCTDPNGKNVQANDPDYVQCMNQMQRKTAEAKLAPRNDFENETGLVNKTSTGMTFGNGPTQTNE